jgi:hypothetical protein
VIASAVDDVMARYAAMMTPKQWAIAFGMLAGMIGIGGVWLPLQQPLGALLGPLLGAAWWKWGLVSGSWGKLVSNAPQGVLFRDRERQQPARTSLFLEEMKALPTVQASQIGDNASAGVSLLTYTQMQLNGIFGLLAQTPKESLPDSLAHAIKVYLKSYWYVPLDPDHLAVLRNVIESRVDQSGYEDCRALIRKSVDPSNKNAAIALLDALVDPRRFAGEGLEEALTPSARIGRRPHAARPAGRKRARVLAP